MTQENSIKHFYEGREIFVTGCTGFVGKFLIEKLLRSCSDLKRIYLLMRPKRGKSTDERLKGLMENPIFSTLKSKNSNVFENIEAIEGDCMEINLGMSPEDCKKLKNVSVIFHCAASVKFEDILQKVILLHARGTRELCKFAETLTDLKSFVYVSTTYSNPNNNVTEEIVYPTDYNWKDYIKFAENFDENTLSSFEKKLIGDFPNTYSFTKNLAENVCKFYSLQKNLPLVIYRPSIVTASEAEPESGLVDSMTGAMALIFSFAVGLCRTVCYFEDSGVDLIPIDICVKGIIVSAWKKWKDMNVQNKSNALDVYNCAGLKYIETKPGKNYYTSLCAIRPFKYMLWKPYMYLAPNNLLAGVNFYFTQLMPAVFIDFILKLMNYKPMVLDALQKLVKGYQGCKCFIEHHTQFKNENFKKLEVELFDCDKTEFFLFEIIKSQHEYIKLMHEGILKHWFNQTEEETKQARFRYKIMTAIEFLFYTIFYCISIYYLYNYIHELRLNISPGFVFGTN